MCVSYAETRQAYAAHVRRRNADAQIPDLCVNRPGAETMIRPGGGTGNFLDLLPDSESECLNISDHITGIMIRVGYAGPGAGSGRLGPIQP